MENKVKLPAFRVGSGYDVHKLVPERKLILCGVQVPYELGLLGHSDADVALHALMDALLGAAALGDIGKHFPDTDERFKSADSMKLTAHVVGYWSVAGRLTMLMLLLLPSVPSWLGLFLQCGPRWLMF